MSQTIVLFRKRLGRAHGGALEFYGENDITRASCFGDLFERNGIYYECDGNEVGLTAEDVAKGTGVIDDGDDVWGAMYLSQLGEEELKAILTEYVRFGRTQLSDDSVDYLLKKEGFESLEEMAAEYGCVQR